jgi:hypothetical protein
MTTRFTVTALTAALSLASAPSAIAAIEATDRGAAADITQLKRTLARGAAQHLGEPVQR